MAANINDKFSRVSTGQRPSSTTVSTNRSTGVTTLVCDDLTGWNTDDAVHFITYKLDSSGGIVSGSQTDFKGIVSGNSLTNIIITGGTDNGNSVGDVVVALPTAAWAKDLSDGLLVAHDQDGSLKSGAVDVSTVLADNVVTTNKVINAAVTPDKLNLAPAEAYVATSESTSSGTFTDLTTTTDSVTVTIGANGLALVTLYANFYNNTSTGQSQIAFTMSGANTASEDTSRMIMAVHPGSYAYAHSATFLMTGLNAGSTTFKMRYRRLTAGTATFSNRRIAVVSL